VTQTDPRERALAGEVPSAAELVRRYGMSLAGARPPLGQYIRDLWGRRHFIISFTRASNAVAYTDSFLGQLWQILTPLLNAGVYFLVFGVLLSTRRGTHNYIGFLTTGIFVFSFMQASIIAGSRSVIGNLGLIRALHFPRASLPLGSTAIAFQQLLVSLSAMIPIVLLTGEPVQMKWLLLAPALLLESLFALGASFVVARIGARIPDTTQLLPFMLRTWLYVSGIFYSITVFTKHHGRWVHILLEYNPGALYPELVRGALLTHNPVTARAWLAAGVWAVTTLAFGLVFFWRAEESYGRG
jgi:teichoic acid transport system permease protein